jgi:MoxR-like ATPase
MMIRILSDLLDKKVVSTLRGEASRRSHVFDKIVGYDGIKRTFLRSLSSKEPVHILLIGPPGQAKTLFLKCILETFGGKKAFFTVGGNASKSGLIDYLTCSQNICLSMK